MSALPTHYWYGFFTENMFETLFILSNLQLLKDVHLICELLATHLHFHGALIHSILFSFLTTPNATGRVSGQCHSVYRHLVLWLQLIFCKIPTWPPK